MSRVVVVAVALLVFVAGAVRWFVPSVTSQRPDIVGTPSLDGKDVRSQVPLPAGRVACIRPLPLDPSVHEVRLLLQAVGSRPVPELRLTATAPGGYRATARFAGYRATPAEPVTARLSSAAPRAEDGQMCIRNAGRRAVGLVGTYEPESLTLPATFVDGKPAGEVDPAVTFFSGESHSIVQHAGTIADRAAGFTGVLPSWLMWPLLLAVLLGIPLGTLAAVVLAGRGTPRR